MSVGDAHDSEPAAMAAALVTQRQAIQERLMTGASGEETFAATTDVADGLIIGRYRTAARRGGEVFTTAGFQHCCLAAIGGYGRRELAPHSDIDLMVLYRPEAQKIVPDFVKQVLHPLWDIGFQVGHSVRTIQDCIELGLKDLTVRTSMMEARFLAGSPELFQQFHTRYLRKVVYKATDKYLEHKLEERRREYKKFGETVYLLEPNVKKSQGGLRDLHVLQWVGMARYRSPTIRELSDRGLLSQGDYRALKEAREFLFRVRAFLHARSTSKYGWLNNSDAGICPICLPSNNSCNSTTGIRPSCMRSRCDSWNDVDRYPCGNAWRDCFPHRGSTPTLS